MSTLCESCAKALSQISGIDAVNVDLENKYAIVDMKEEVSDDLLKQAVVDEAGYELVKIEKL